MDEVPIEEPNTPLIRQIPVLHFSYGNKLLVEIGIREPISIDDLFAAVGPETLFKGEREHRAPRERALSLVRYSQELGLLEPTPHGLRLSDVGRRYVDGSDPVDVFRVTTAQAEILRDQLKGRWTDSGMLYGAALSLALWSSADNAAEIGREDFGRALGAVAGKDDWTEPRTFASQADRFTAFLKDAGMLGEDGELTPAGQQTLDQLDLPDVPPLAEVLEGLEQLSADRRAWMVRAGEHGANESVALDHGAAVIGWNRLPSLEGMSRDALFDEIDTRYSDFYEGDRRRIGQATGQVWSFVNNVAVGDLVVLPLQDSPKHVAIGVVKSRYRLRTEAAFQNDARHTRDVDWIAKSVPYDRFDEELARRFDIQGTVRQIQLPDAASRVLSAIAASSDSLIHLVLKWSRARGPLTVEHHREVVDANGAVWWRVLGKSGAPTLGKQFLQRFRAQLDRGDVTYVYLFGPTSWRTRMLDLRTTPPDTGDANLIPPYYDPAANGLLWVKLADFEPRNQDWLTTNLALANDPSKTVSGRGDRRWAVVVHRPSAGEHVAKRETWWVNQTSTYTASRNGSLMWAPQLAKDGHPRPYWELLKEANVGDIVLHYAAGHVRAVSSISATWVEASRPTGFPAENSWQNDGYLVRARYRELAEPIAVEDIPVDWRKAQYGPFDVNGKVQQAYFFKLGDDFVELLAATFPELGLSGGEETSVATYEEPDFDTILKSVHDAGMAITERMLRRYHASLKTRGFVILAGVSGTGKTWLAELYAKAVGAAYQVVPVAPNWTTNEDLLGYWNPLENKYHDTAFSQFLRDAATEYAASQVQQRAPQPFHLVLDEMNLAHVEYYFAKFLSAMELRARNTTASIDIAPNAEVLLPPNLLFVGTVNVDETTKGFADKVYDRAQLLELELEPSQLAAHMDGKSYAKFVMDVFHAVGDVAPFAYRTLDEIARYADEMEGLGASVDDALDEQLLQKILPKLKGTDQRIGIALVELRDLTEASHPLSHAKVVMMLETFNQHGFASYF